MLTLTFDPSPQPSRIANVPGDDFVVYEAGTAGAPEAFAVAVRSYPSGDWSGYRYEFADAHETSAGVNSGHFATGFDLDAFGLPSDAEVDAVRIINLHNSDGGPAPAAEDRVDDASGQGFVQLDAGPLTGFPFFQGPAGAGSVPFTNGLLDADITYVVAASPLTNVVPPPPPPPDFNLAGFDFYTSNSVRKASVATTIGYASPSTGQVWPDPLFTIGNLVDGGGFAQNLDLTGGAAGNNGRTTATLSFTTEPLVNCRVPNLAGDDFVVYEAGTAGEPEAFAVAVRSYPAGAWSQFRYEFADAQETSPGVNSGHFATGFDLSDFGIAEGGEIDQIRVVNLHNANAVTAPNLQDRVDDASGEGNVSFDVGGLVGFGILRGPQATSNDAYLNNQLDADITYVASLHDLVCSDVEPDTDCISGAGAQANYFVNGDGTAGLLNLSGGTTYTIDFPFVDGRAITGNKTYRLLVEDFGPGSGGEFLGFEVTQDANGAGGHLLDALDETGSVAISASLAPGAAPSFFDLRLVLTQITAGPDTGKWTVAPSYRVGAGAFTPFAGTSFITPTAFDLTSARIVLATTAGAGGTVCVATPQASPGAVAEVFVDDDFTPATTGFGVDHFTSVNAGVAAVASGGTVNVAAGLYPVTSAIIINKPLTLVGPQQGVDARLGPCATRTAGSAAEAILDGQFAVGHVIRISSGDVLVDGFEVRNATGDIIDSPASAVPYNNVVLSNCIVHGSSGDDGVQLRDVVNSAICFNLVYDVAQDAVNLSNGSRDSAIEYNEAFNSTSEHGVIYVYDENAGPFALNIRVAYNLVRDSAAAAGITMGSDSGNDASDTSATVIANVVRDVDGNGIVVQMSDVAVLENEVSGVTADLADPPYGGIVARFAVSDLSIACNTVYDNALSTSSLHGAGGLALSADAIAPTFVVMHNNFQGNTPYGALNEGVLMLGAQNNYWGAVDGPDDDAGIINGSGDAISLNVAAAPFSETSYNGVPMVTPAALDFGIVALNSVTTQAAVLDHDGTCPLRVLCPAVSISGPDADKFSVEPIIAVFPFSLAAGDTMPFTITYAPGPGSCATHSAVATVSTSQGDVIVPLSGGTQCPDIGLEKTVSPTSALNGDPLTYTFVITNNGDGDATSVTLTDLIPAGLTVQTVTTSQGSYSFPAANSLVVELGTLAPTAVAVVTVDVVANVVGTVTNDAAVSLNESDGAPADNVDSATATLLPVADLVVAKTATPATLLNGGQATFEVVVTNLGPDAATGVQLTDTLDAGLNIDSTSAGSASGQVVTANLGTLAAGASTTVTVVATAVEAGSKCNDASVTAGEADPVSANNSASACVTVDASADLEVTVTDSPDPVQSGQQFSHVFTVTNNGPNAATAVVLTTGLSSDCAEIISAVPGQGTANVVGGAVTANFGTLASGASTTLIVTVKAIGPDQTITNIGIVSATQADPVPGNNQATATTTQETRAMVVTSDVFTSSAGWAPFRPENAGLWSTSFDPGTGALKAHVGAVADTRLRATGLYTQQSNYVPYGTVGTANHIRGKFYVYTGGQTNPAQLNTIPTVRLRLSNRFAVNSMFEVYSHVNSDPLVGDAALELRPSSDASKPSMYRVDFDPVDVPFLTANSYSEGIMRGFEAYGQDPQDNGFIALKEVTLMVYPAAVLDGCTPPVRVLAATASDAGDLGLGRPGASATLNNLIPNGDFPPSSAADPATSVPRHTEGPAGITMDTLQVPAERIGVALREFGPGSNPLDASYVRVAPGMQYRIRAHMTSTEPANRQSMIRLRGRSVRFAWSQKLELGGAFAAGAENNAIAQQALPGVGSLNPDKTGSENGGWYNLLMHTPLSPDIRTEFPAGTPVEARMPLLSAQPGPQQPGTSLLDLRVGADLIDTLSFTPSAKLEKGHVTIDRIEIYAYPLVEDGDYAPVVPLPNMKR